MLLVALLAWRCTLLACLIACKGMSSFILELIYPSRFVEACSTDMSIKAWSWGDSGRFGKLLRYNSCDDCIEVLRFF